MTQNIKSSQNDGENYYQISDDDIDECDDLGEDSLLEEADCPTSGGIGGRGPYERAWTTDATRALIHIRGPMEGRFTEGRQKRTALWLHCTRQLQKLGYRYSAAKVQKKWHNILITYNKNLSKKYLSGHVHWEFFEEMFKYLQGKKANCEAGTVGLYHQQQQQQQQEQHQQEQHQQQEQQQQQDDSNCTPSKTPDPAIFQPLLQIELKKPKLEYSDPLPLEISHANGSEQDLEHNSKIGGRTSTDENDFTYNEQKPDANSVWWKDYFERKLQVDREKVQLQKEMHREVMQFNKMSLSQQEKIERIKIDAINNLTNAMQKLVESKNRRIQ